MRKLLYTLLSVAIFVCGECAAEVVALRNVATVMAAGGDPILALPSQVSGLDATGELTGTYTVTWNTNNLYFAKNSVVNVPGTATVNDETMSVTGSVRTVVRAGVPENLVYKTLPFCRKRTGGASTRHFDCVRNLTDGKYAGGDSYSWDSWNRYGSVYSNETHEVFFVLNDTATVDSFKIWYQNMAEPPYVAIATSADNHTWTTPDKLTGTSLGGFVYEYSLPSSRSGVNYVKIFFGGNSDGSESEVAAGDYKYSKVYEIEIWGVATAANANIASECSEFTVVAPNDPSIYVGNQAGEIPHLTNGVDSVADKAGWHGVNGDMLTWGAWGKGHIGVEARFTWSEARTVKRVLCYANTSNIYGPNAPIVVKDASDNVLASVDPSEVTTEYATYPKVSNCQCFPVSLPANTVTTGLKVYIENSRGRLGLGEIMVIADVPIVDGNTVPFTDADLNDLKVDGSSVANFASSTYTYTVTDGAGITAATSASNAGITILPLNNSTTNAYVVTIAEDGESVAKYSVFMPESCHHVSTEITKEAKAPTCTEDGWTAEYSCTSCHEVVIASEPLPATGHGETYVDGASAATCTTAGYSGDTKCSVCHATITIGEVIPALGHNWGAWIIDQAASFSSAGARHRECSRCPETENEVIPQYVNVFILRNVAVAMNAGDDVFHALPERVAGLDATGESVNRLYDVEWNTNGLSFASDTTVQVPGTASVNDGTMSVTASVRVMGSGICSTTATASCLDPGNVKKYIASAVVDSNPPASNIWSDPGDYVFESKNVSEVRIKQAWSSSKVISKIRMCYFDKPYGSKWCLIPDVVGFYTDDACTQAIATDGGRLLETITNTSSDGYFSWYEYELTTPRSITSLVGKFKHTEKATTILRFWAICVDSAPEASDSAVLNALTVTDGELVNFQPTTYSYAVQDATAIATATAPVNTGITILPKNAATTNAYVVTVSEDCEHTAKYSVYMPESPAVAALRNIATVISEGDDVMVALTNQVAELDATGEIIGYHSVTWNTNGLVFAKNNVINVPGTALIRHETMSVTGSVRVVAKATEAVFINGTATLVNSNGYYSGNNNFRKSDDPDQRGKTDYGWSDTVVHSQGDSSYCSITWSDGAHDITSINAVYHIGNSLLLPSSVKFYSDPERHNEIKPTSVEDLGLCEDTNYTKVKYNFNLDSPISALYFNLIRGEKEFSMVRFCIFEGGTVGGDSTKHATKDLNDLKVDGTTVNGFTGSTYEYTVPGGAAITSATASDNVGITVLGKNNSTGAAYVVTVAEDGEHTGKYTVNLGARPQHGLIILINGL